MKKNILSALSVIGVIVIAGLIGAGLFLHKAQNPSGCISLETSNYQPVYEILDGATYAADGEEMTKINGVQNSCLAVLDGKDTSVDKCKAIENLAQTVYVIAYNAANSGNMAEVKKMVSEIESIKKSVNASASSCKEASSEFNEVADEILEGINSLNKSQK